MFSCIFGYMTKCITISIFLFALFTTVQSETVHYLTYGGIKMNFPGPEISTYIDSTQFEWPKEIECPDGYKLFWEIEEHDLFLTTVYRCSDGKRVSTKDFFDQYAKQGDSLTTVFIENKYSAREFHKTLNSSTDHFKMYDMYLIRTGKKKPDADSASTLDTSVVKKQQTKISKSHCISVLRDDNYCGGLFKYSEGTLGSYMSLMVMYENTLLELSSMIESNRGAYSSGDYKDERLWVRQLTIGRRFGYERYFVLVKCGLAHLINTKKISNSVTTPIINPKLNDTYWGLTAEFEGVINYAAFFTVYVTGILTTEDFITRAGVGLGLGYLFNSKPPYNR
ncbi:MAG: hypothetical protein OCD76_08930 [Reichenbachiella sp.]